MPENLEPFVPSEHAFAFTNAWPSAPAISQPTPMGMIALGNAAAGLCGGMVFAALDYWHAGRPAPAERPVPGDPLYRFIVRRLIDSWHLPGGPLEYYQWMLAPDGDQTVDLLGRRVLRARGLAWRTIAEQWPQVRSDLDRGIPVALGIVTIRSPAVAKLSLNHQVLACGYLARDEEVSLRVYDPNSGPDDDVTIRFDPRRPASATSFRHTIAIDHPVRGFFRTPYAPVPPPPR